MHLSKRFILLTTLLLLPIVFASRAADIREGLVSYWPLDTISGDGSTTPDLVTSNHMTLQGLTTGSLVDAKRGKGFVFDGSTTMLTFTAQPGVDTGLPISQAPDFTVMFWVNGLGQGQTDRRIFSEGSTVNNDPLFNIGTHNAGTDGTIDIFIRNSGTRINHAHSPSTALDGAWHHVAWTDQNGQAKLYIDGALDYTNTYTRGPTAVDVTSIGGILRAAASHWFAGTIDEVSAWERVLTQEEIQQIMTNGIATPVPAFAPVVKTAPQGATNLVVGDSYTLRAQAIGTRPLSFQWRKNGAVIAGATASSLNLANVALADSGDYTVVVANSVNSVTSPAATIRVSPPPGPNLTNDLVSYWPLDEVVGTKTPDVISGYDMNLANLTAADLVTGKVGKAFRFVNANRTMLQRVNSAGEKLPINQHPALTIAFWANVAGAGQVDLRVFSEGNTADANPLFNLGTASDASSGQLDFYFRQAGWTDVNHLRSVSEPLDGTWHHLAFVQQTDGSRALYVDGVRDEVDIPPKAAGAWRLNTTTIGGILRANATHWVSGLLDEVALWSRALSQDEIQMVVTNGVPRPVVQIPLAIRIFKPDLPAYAAGETVTLRWDVTKDVQVSIDQGIGDVTSRTVAGAGSIDIPLPSTKTFTLTLRRGTETLTNSVTVTAIGGVASGWTLLDNFDRYPVGPLTGNGSWADLDANDYTILAVNTNRYLSSRVADGLAVLSLGSLAVSEGQERTLFFRFLLAGDEAEPVRGQVALTDRPVRFGNEGGGDIGPGAVITEELGAGRQIGGYNGWQSQLEVFGPVLLPATAYNVWVDIKNGPFNRDNTVDPPVNIDTGDRYSVYMQKDGDAQRTTIFTNFLASRNPVGQQDTGFTTPHLTRLIVGALGGHSTTTNLYIDDIYLSKSGFNSTVPRAAGYTAPLTEQPLRISIVRAAAQVEITWSEGTLESAPAVTGGWTAVTGAVSPHRITPDGTQRFFRAKR